tara:strand:+ start:447 stop:1265 length:819 start_codon:yes stop_codon:yes gene_type:complete
MSRRSRVPGNFNRQSLGQAIKKGVSDWIPVNVVDNSWTAFGSNSVVASVAATSAGLQFQNNAAAFDHHFDNADETADIYYKLLRTEAGDPIKFSDYGWNIDFLIKRQVTNNDNGCIHISICDDPTDTTNRNWVGVTYTNMASGQGKMRVGTGIAMNSHNHSNSDRVFVQVLNAMDTDGDDGEVIHVITGCHLDSSYDLLNAPAVKSNMGDSHQEFDESDDVYLMVSSAYDVSSTSEPGSNTNNTWKIFYRLNYSLQALDPEYRVAGRALDHM